MDRHPRDAEELLGQMSRRLAELEARQVPARHLLGGVSMYAGVGPPPYGWLLCDGAAISRTEYADLFAEIGTAYGAGDGSTTFNVPNYKGRFPVGMNAADADFDVRGEAGGAKTHTLVEANLPAHAHSMNSHIHPMGVQNASPGIREGTGAYVAVTVPGTANTGASPTTVTGSTGSGTAVTHLPPFLTTPFVIRALP